MFCRVQDRYSLEPGTVFLAMSLYDSLLTTDQWELDAVTCLILAMKFREKDDRVPLIKDIMKEAQVSSNYQQVCTNELTLSQNLNWNLNQVTVLSFVENFANQGFLVLSTDPIPQGVSERGQYYARKRIFNKVLGHLKQVQTEVLRSLGGFREIVPEVVAVSVLIQARGMARLDNQHIKAMFEPIASQVTDCVKMLQVLIKAPESDDGFSSPTLTSEETT